MSAVTRAYIVLVVGVVCSVVAVIASSTTGSASFGGPTTLDDVIAGVITTSLTGLGFGLLAVTSRWMSRAGLVATLAVMATGTLWVSAEMWNSPNPFDGLAIILLMIALPPISAIGALLDIGARALARRMRAAKESEGGGAPR